MSGLDQSERDTYGEFRSGMRLRRRMVLTSVATMSGCLLLGGWVTDDIWLPMLVVSFSLSAAADIVFSFSRCARCDKMVFFSSFSHPFRARCAHCGLRLYSDVVRASTEGAISVNRMSSPPREPSDD